jgi:hypothetical protein
VASGSLNKGGLKKARAIKAQQAGEEARIVAMNRRFRNLREGPLPRDLAGAV